MSMKKKESNQTREEKIALQFMKTAMNTSKKMGAKIVGVRKA
ncbi:hypothetical protein QUF56_12395 [Ureibacillus composti]|nr:hypothetical protein [Ureibacillus composti]